MNMLAAMLCASIISGLPWDGTVPKVVHTERDTLGSATASYSAYADTVVTTRSTNKPRLAHETGHALQMRNGLPLTEDVPLHIERNAGRICLKTNGWRFWENEWDMDFLYREFIRQENERKNK